MQSGARLSTARVPCLIPSSRSGSGSRSMQTLLRPSIWSPVWAKHATGVWALVDKYQDRRLADRVFDSGVDPQPGGIATDQRQRSRCTMYGRLAGAILYANASLRADPNVVKKNRRGQSGLWGYPFLGDLPIVLLKIGDPATSHWSVSWCKPTPTGGGED